MDDEKYEAIIAKQLERENNIKELKKDYIDDIENPKKQITVKIFPNTHKKLKVIAASKDTSLEKIATAIVEDKVEELDIVDYVKRALHVTPLEYNLLSLFFKNIGKVLTTQFILKEIYGIGYGTDTQALRALMAGLRRKIEPVPARPRYILTEIGVGYRLVDE